MHYTTSSVLHHLRVHMKHLKSAKCVINITYVQHMVLMDAGENEANKNLCYGMGGVRTE